jgi:hypothetical protein
MAVRKKTWCCLVVTALTILLGAVIFGGAWLAQEGIRDFVKSGIYDQVIIDSSVCRSATHNFIF